MDSEIDENDKLFLQIRAYII